MFSLQCWWLVLQTAADTAHGNVSMVSVDESMSKVNPNRAADAEKGKKKETEEKQEQEAPEKEGMEAP